MLFQAAMQELVLKDSLAVFEEDNAQLRKPLQAYSETHGLDDFIYMAYGETWYRSPQQLRDYLANTEAMDSGYELSAWGRPSYRQVLKSYIFKDHGLTEQDGVEVGFSSTGTRERMYDFARLVAKRAKQKPVAVFALPGWDYEAVFTQNGFTCAPYLLRQEDACFQPNIKEVRTHLETICTSPENGNVVLIINTQHNPTGVTFTQENIMALLQMAIEYRLSVMIDDAYYGVVHPGVGRVSTLTLWVNMLKSQSYRPLWLAVRSLGKQFFCNGWGLGAAVSETSTLMELETLFLDHTYPYGGMLQSAMSKYLSSPESAGFLASANAEYAEKKKWISDFLHAHADYPKSCIYPSDCTPYYLLKVPNRYLKTSNPCAAFKQDVMENGHLLVGSGSMVYGYGFSGLREWVRLYLGPDQNIIEEAMKRLGRYSWK